MHNGTSSGARSDTDQRLTRLCELDDKVTTSSKHLRTILDELFRNQRQRRHRAVNVIAEVDEHVVEATSILATRKLGLGNNVVEYHSAYNGRSPRNESNDTGADIVVRSPNGTDIPIEAEQRTHGYTMKQYYDSEVRAKLRRNGIYAFFNGYDRKHFKQVREWANQDGIRIVSLRPLPYHRKKNEYSFDRAEVINWLVEVYSRLETALMQYLTAILRQSNQSHDHIMGNRSNNISIVATCPAVADLSNARDAVVGRFNEIWRHFKLRFTVMREFSACINHTLVRPTRGAPAADELHVRQGLGHRIAATRNFGLALVSLWLSYGGSP